VEVDFMMRNRLVTSILATALAAVLLPVIFAQSAKPSKDAKSNDDGISRDLTGVWQYDHYQRALFPKGVTPPFTPWAEARFKAADTSVNDPNLGCLPHGIPRMMMAPLPIEIFQEPGTVLVEQESLNELRHIHLNRQHLKDPDPTYNGDSIGKWEGNTLVVDTIGFNDITWLDHVGLPHSDQLHVVERIRRMDHDTLVDDFTIEDPKAYTKSWTASQTYKLHPEWEIQEYTCDRNQYVFHPQQ
jgi:hypothetical protein